MTMNKRKKNKGGYSHEAHGVLALPWFLWFYWEYPKVRVHIQHSINGLSFRCNSISIIVTFV